MELNPIYKLLPTEDHIMEIEIPILEPKNVEISIYKLRNKIYRFMEKYYSDIFDIESCRYSEEMSRHLDEINDKYKNKKLENMLKLLFITYNTKSYSLNIYVNWKRFVRIS